MFQASALGLERDNRKLFSNLTFNVEVGTLVRVSGANGSGKSSLLRVLAGLCTPSEGTLSWRDESQPLCYMGHQLGLQPTLSPIQNLKIWLKLSGVPGDLNDIQEALRALALQDLGEVPCENLSRGECQRVALAALWLNAPRCWILDEPFTALDQKGISVVCQRLTAHLKQGGIIFIATHQGLDIPSQDTLEIKLGIGVPA